MQEDLNESRFPDWRERNFDWNSAILVETAELIEHMDFKWWSKDRKGPNYDQARMEAIDILHFLLSRLTHTAVQYGIPGYISEVQHHFDAAPKEEMNAVSVIRKANIFLRNVLTVGHLQTALGSFADLLFSLNLPLEEVYRLYVAKWCLNKVRWANDYGRSYHKTWFGEEDNEYITRLVKGMPIDSESFIQDVKAAVEAAYESVKQANSVSLPAGV